MKYNSLRQIIAKYLCYANFMISFCLCFAKAMEAQVQAQGCRFLNSPSFPRCRCGHRVQTVSPSPILLSHALLTWQTGLCTCVSSSCPTSLEATNADWACSVSAHIAGGRHALHLSLPVSLSVPPRHPQLTNQEPAAQQLAEWQLLLNIICVLKQAGPL